MKKKKYIFSLIVLIISMFYGSDFLVYAADITSSTYHVEWIKEAERLTNCRYSDTGDKNGQTKAIYSVYKTGSFFTSSMVGGKPILLTKWKGDSNISKEIDDVSPHEESLLATIYLKGSCPDYMALRVVSAFPGTKYEAAAFFDKTEAENYFKDNDVVLYLYEDNKDSVTMKEISLVNNYFFEDYTSGRGGHKYDEGRYFCNYKMQDGYKYEVPFSTVFAKAAHKYGGQMSWFYGVDDPNQSHEKVYGERMFCPAVLYNVMDMRYEEYITYNVYNAFDWPAVCKKDNVLCTKYTETSDPVTYKEEDENEDVENGYIEGTYYYYNKDIDLVYKNTNAQLKVSSQDGQISDLYLTVNNERAFFAAPSDEDLSNYFLKILRDGVGLPDKLFCGSESYLTENGLKTTSTIANNTPNQGFDGLYCYLDYNLTGKQYSYFSIYVKDIENYKNTVNGGYDIGIDFDDKCKDEKSEECLKYQYEQYKKAQKLVDECRRIYVDFNSTEDDIKNCDDLNGLIETWAKAGYFGDRIITTQSGSSCDAVLGALGVWLKRIYDIMKFAVPIVIVVLGIKDFISGTISGKDDALKKAGSTFVKRLIWGAAFVALPVLITMILTFAFGGSFADICIF